MLETRFKQKISYHLLVYSVGLPATFRISLTGKNKQTKKPFLELITFFD